MCAVFSSGRLLRVQLIIGEKMKSSSKHRPTQTISVANHLWDTFEQMALEMGANRDDLINQAMFMFARLNGFIVPGRNGLTRSFADLSDQKPARPPPPPIDEEDPTPVAGIEPALSTDINGMHSGDSHLADDDGLTDAPPAASSKALLVSDSSGDFAGYSESEHEHLQAAERVLKSAAELESFIEEKASQTISESSDPSLPASCSTDDQVLYIVVKNGALEKITKDRYLIGRGKHCDLVINSGKVSREHAAIVKDDGEYFLEDLDSSNGTWFNKQRIKRRKIENGDEYLVCSEKLRCVIS